MAYLGRRGALAPVNSADIPDGSVTAAKVTADVATQAELDTVSTVASAALPKAGGAMTGAITTNSTFDGVDIATRDAATITELELLERNVAMLGFFRASDDAKAQYSLVDQVIDQFQDATGIDAGASTAEVHDNTSKFYCATTGAIGPTHFEGTGSKQTFTVPTGVTSITIHAYGAQHNNYGGYSVGTLGTSGGTQYSIVVGTVETANPGATAAGYGGGGPATNAVGGGGLSGLFTGTGAITDFTSTAVQDRAVIIAGGSGSRSGSGAATPGAGGGTDGDSGNGPAGYGTQSAAGAGSGGGASGNLMWGGASGSSNETGAGGGGYYGGGGHNSQQGGGGGSGYIGGGTLSGSISSTNTYAGASSNKTNSTHFNLATSGNCSGRVSIDYDARVFANMTLQSVATTAESAPTKGDIIIWIEDNAGTATVNTDIKAFISRDGSAFTGEVTLVDEGHWGSTGKRILVAHNVDLSGIASGTAMKYKITTHNQAIGKETRVHGVSLSWG